MPFDPAATSTAGERFLIADRRLRPQIARWATPPARKPRPSRCGAAERPPRYGPTERLRSVDSYEGPRESGRFRWIKWGEAHR